MAATCNGLLFIVKYLVENKAADINAMDDVCTLYFHQSVCGHVLVTYTCISRF